MNKKIIEEYHAIIKNKISQLCFESAFDSIKKLISCAPNDDMAYYYMGVCLFAQERYDDAVNFYKTALKINPAHARAYFNLGVCYYLGNYYDKALINIGKALIIFSKLKELDAKKRCMDALNLIEVQRDT